MESGRNPAEASLCVLILFLSNLCQEEYGNMSNAGESLTVCEPKALTERLQLTARPPPSQLQRHRSGIAPLTLMSCPEMEDKPYLTGCLFLLFKGKHCLVSVMRENGRGQYAVCVCLFVCLFKTGFL